MQSCKEDKEQNDVDEVEITIDDVKQTSQAIALVNDEKEHEVIVRCSVGVSESVM